MFYYFLKNIRLSKKYVLCVFVYQLYYFNTHISCIFLFLYIIRKQINDYRGKYVYQRLVLIEFIYYGGRGAQSSIHLTSR